MSRIPNPFAGGAGQQQQGPQSSSSPGHQQGAQATSTPGFLIMTRPPSGSNRYGGRGYNTHNSTSQHNPNQQKNNFIPFSSNGGNNSSQEGNRRGGGGGRGRFNHGGGGRNFSAQGSPRFAYPFQQSPARINNPYGQNQGFANTPRNRQNNKSGARYSDTHDRAFGDQKKFSSNGNSRRGRDRGPLSDVPIDKFVSNNMIQDPWAEFDDDVDDNLPQHPQSSPVLVTLDDSEIVIDSDASVIVENSYEEGISGTECDSSPVHDTGSDSPYVATSSTSEKDTGSDSTSDA
nr:pro-resilin-like [Procambarus clarkii]